MKARKLSAVAVAAARRVLSEAGVVEAADIQVEALAMRHGALVLYRRTATFDGSIVRAGDHAVICVSDRLQGTARGRSTAAHELGHHKLHRATNHFSQCQTVNEPRGSREYWIERDAEEFATELLMPERLAAPLCTAKLPMLEDVEKLSRTFRTSLESSGIRYVQLAKSPCALVKTVGGRIKWATESATFPGKIVRGRQVDALAAAAFANRRANIVSRDVPGKVWGAPRGTLREDALPLGPSRGVLSWIRVAE